MEIPGNGINFKRTIINSYLYECNEYRVKYDNLRKELKYNGFLCRSCNCLISKNTIQMIGFGECCGCILKRYLNFTEWIISKIRYYII